LIEKIEGHDRNADLGAGEKGGCEGEIGETLGHFLSLREGKGKKESQHNTLSRHLEEGETKGQRGKNKRGLYKFKRKRNELKRVKVDLNYGTVKKKGRKRGKNLYVVIFK